MDANATNGGEAPGPSEAEEIATANELPDRQVEEYTLGADFAWVVAALTARRDQIVERWLDATVTQPFHKGRRERAVANHIPILLDALIGLLSSTAPTWITARAPLEDVGILAAAQSHARVRAGQGLAPADVVVEFRLLRQEIWRALRASLPDEAPTGDVVAAEMLINDALDSAITQGLAALTDYVQQLREEFLATTVHDVLQPLTAISGEAQMLARLLSKTASDPARLRTGVERINASAKRMTAMLEVLTDMSKIALGSLDLQLREANLEEIVADALQHCTTEEAERTRVKVRQGADLTGVWDPTRLLQVVGNLLGNAFRYSAAGTPVEVDLDADEDTAMLIVRDQGIGIPAEDLKNIFSRYHRSSNALESEIEGSGLGLYICKGIVDAHDGRIQAESAGPAEGTTITVTLPRHANQEKGG
jgi:signal transduction histidine kinase